MVPGRRGVSIRSRMAAAIAAFEAFGEVLDAVGADQGDLVLVHLEADVGARHVVQHDQVDALALALGAGALQAVTGLGREADQHLARAAGGADGGEDVGGRHELQRPVAGPRALRVTGVGRGGSRRRPRPSARCRPSAARASASRSRSAAVGVSTTVPPAGGARRRCRAASSPRRRAAGRRRQARRPCGRWSGCRGSAPGRAARACRRR